MAAMGEITKAVAVVAQHRRRQNAFKTENENETKKKNVVETAQ